MNPWPNLKQETVGGCVDMLQFISRQRDVDIRDWNNLQNIFVNGRKVGKIPTSSADIAATDRVGDISFQDDYVYYVYNNAGTAEWRRVAAGAW